jgi:hypothetical protein
MQGSPSQVNGVGLRTLSRRRSWVRIPPPALQSDPIAFLLPVILKLKSEGRKDSTLVPMLKRLLPRVRSPRTSTTINATFGNKVWQSFYLREKDAENVIKDFPSFTSPKGGKMLFSKMLILGKNSLKNKLSKEKRESSCEEIPTPCTNYGKIISGFTKGFFWT